MQNLSREQSEEEEKKSNPNTNPILDSILGEFIVLKGAELKSVAFGTVLVLFFWLWCATVTAFCWQVLSNLLMITDFLNAGSKERRWWLLLFFVNAIVRLRREIKWIFSCSSSSP
ncbi:transmembrane protein, putative [Medicago truncatula]|uniref:Transmembrane protein, putative n=1 Tax=Medicago truncatula TaxID=3880 RepID=G7JZD1_MEDTR|nr:transmembrane protein, putative [Medicago truncatula]